MSLYPSALLYGIGATSVLLAVIGLLRTHVEVSSGIDKGLCQACRVFEAAAMLMSVVD